MRDGFPDLRTLGGGLSARLLILTIAFVMLAEVLIFAPSIARFRQSYLEERLAAAHLAILALDATPDQMVSADLERELLTHVGAHKVALRRPGQGKLMLMAAQPIIIDDAFDLRRGTFFGLIGDAARALAVEDGRLLRIVGVSPKDPEVVVEVVLNEAPLRAEMLGFSKRILALSLVISLFTAALVYLSLHWLIVRPMRRITDSMTAFRDNPEDASRIIEPSRRSDEIGVAQRELATMQAGLRAALQQKTRLAALGIAVSKINHDLKNILATALLVSDRLLGSEDPEVRRVTPTLMGAIDRAVSLCGQTLNFTREGPAPLDLTSFDLRQLVEDVGRSLPATASGQGAWDNRLDAGTEVRADREQLFRVLSNLGQNAIEAGAKSVTVSARTDDGHVEILVGDDGPGLPDDMAERIFERFYSHRPAGEAFGRHSGLGLSIARQIVEAHGGSIRAENRRDAHGQVKGARFVVRLPL